jgi:hypothetical protein
MVSKEKEVTMNKIRRAVCGTSVVLFWVGTLVIYAQRPPDVAPLLVDSKSRPDLAVPIEKVMKLKAVVRKHRFARGEMLILDIAILNFGDGPYYTPSVKSAELSIRNGNRNLGITPYVISETTRPIVQQGSKKIESDSQMLLVGCQERPFQLQRQLSTEYDETQIFVKSLFTNWGDACLNISRPSRLSITVTLENDRVVVGQGGATNIRTAVGRLESEPVIIQVQ